MDVVTDVDIGIGRGRRWGYVFSKPSFLVMAKSHMNSEHSISFTYTEYTELHRTHHFIYITFSLLKLFPNFLSLTIL